MKEDGDATVDGMGWDDVLSVATATDLDASKLGRSSSQNFPSFNTNNDDIPIELLRTYDSS